MNISRSTNSLLKRLHYGAINPVRDWLVLITLSAIALACIVVWNAWTFDIVAHGGVIGSAATSSQPVFSQSSLDSIRTIFENRSSEEEKYEVGTYHYADPSQ